MIRKDRWPFSKETLRMTQSHFAVEDLRLLQAIGEHGSLSAASRRLGVDHSNVFRRLGGMEQRLGVRLFDRARDGYAPTPAGETAIATAARVLAEIELLERRLAGEELRPSGIVRLTTTDTLAPFIAPMLKDFRKAHPEIVTEVIISNAFLTLTRRDADVALRPASQPGDALVGRKVAEAAFAVYGVKALAAQLNSKRSSLETLDWVGFDESIAHIGAAQWLAAHVPSERVVYRSNSILAIEEAARAGLGLALLPCYQGERAPNLVRVSETIPEAMTPIWLLTHRDLRRVARIRVFLDFMAEAIAHDRAALDGVKAA
jgi:molybdate transport repressor ModE-like protein